MHEKGHYINEIGSIHLAMSPEIIKLVKLMFSVIFSQLGYIQAILEKYILLPP